MTDTEAAVATLFDGYERATTSLDLAFLQKAYAETFMFLGPASVQSVKLEDFLRVVPRRAGFFKSIGLVQSSVVGRELTALDARHVLVKVQWRFRFEKDGLPAVDSPGSATYVLRLHEGVPQIVFQLDHQDLTEEARRLGYAS